MGKDLRKKAVFGLIKGRHQMPIDNYIFNTEDIDVFEFGWMQNRIHEALKYVGKLDLYVTGLTTALVEVINYCVRNDIKTTLYHFNRDTEEYLPQELSIYNEPSYFRGYEGLNMEGENTKW